MTGIPIALAGVGKIARDQHVPSLAASPDFELVAAVTGHEPPDGVPAFSSIADMKAALRQVSAVSICTPPRGRLELIRQAFEHGLDVMIEKPPAATVSEARAFVDLAAQSGRVLFVTWHSRAAPAVEPARAWLQGRRVRHVRVTWKEDVRVWHPGQHWIWEPGIGVFDPGINALSVLTRMLPGPAMVETATLRFPSNKAAPIAARLSLVTAAGVPVDVELDFDQRGQPVWEIEADTDGGRLALTHGASRMSVDGKSAEVSKEGEYPALYRRFATLLARREIDADLRPFELVADTFLLARREVAQPFEDF